MKKKILKNLFLSVLFAGGFSTLAQANEPIQLLNTGAMNVDGYMHVQGSVQMRSIENSDRAVVVRHDGVTHITGNFWQDAAGNVFEVTDEHWENNRSRAIGINPSATGWIHFVDRQGATTPGERTIAPSIRAAAFDRRVDYVAFPGIRVATRDEIIVPPQMGIDAREIRRSGITDPTEGVMILESDVIGDTQWNASLRVTGVAANAADRLVDADAVVVHKHIWHFRQTGAAQQTATPFMPFAAPYWDMRAAYFAGHWVRRPIFVNDRNSVTAPLGNRAGAPPNNAFIGRDQFIEGVHEPMGFQAREATARAGMQTLDERRLNVTRQGYLVQFQPQGVNPDDANILNVTIGAGEHTDDAERLYFDGNPFPNVVAIERRPNRQLFAGQPIMREHTGNSPVVTVQNWLVGNSFTSGLNTRAIAEFLASHSGAFDAIWLFPHGSTAYIPLSLNDLTTDTRFNEDIQAMGIFVVRANNGGTSIPVEIGPEFQVHTGGISSFVTAPASARQAGLRTMQEQNSGLTFVLTPEHNPLMFSRSEILFSADANLDADDLDMVAVGGNTSMFQLFGTNNATARLQRNALPHTAEMALLGVAPAVDEMWVTLTAIGVEDFPMVDLYDRQTGHFIQDLTANNRYTFLLSPNDDPNRFEVRFAPRNGTVDIEDTHLASWSIFNNRSELTVSGLNYSLIGETMRIFNAAGILHIQQPITGTVEHINIQDLPSGVYLITIQGRTERFVK